jgi:hypothetical protein
MPPGLRCMSGLEGRTAMADQPTEPEGTSAEQNQQPTESEGASAEQAPVPPAEQAPPPPPPTASQPTPPTAWTPEQRKAALAQAVAQSVAQGNRVESHADYQAIVVKGHRPNHVLHLILTIITLGLWLLVWIPVAVLQKEQRTIIRVDDYGNTLVERV